MITEYSYEEVVAVLSDHPNYSTYALVLALLINNSNRPEVGCMDSL